MAVGTDASDELEESEDRKADRGHQVDDADAVLEHAAFETEIKECCETRRGLLLSTPLLRAAVGDCLLLVVPLLLGLLLGLRLLGRTPGRLLVPVLHVLLGGVLLTRGAPFGGGRDGLLGLGVPILRRGHGGLFLRGRVPVLGCGLDGCLILRRCPPILGGLLRRRVPILGAGPLVVRHGGHSATRNRHRHPAVSACAPE